MRNSDRQVALCGRALRACELAKLLPDPPRALRSGGGFQVPVKHDAGLRLGFHRSCMGRHGPVCPWASGIQEGSWGLPWALLQDAVLSGLNTG